MSPAPIQLPASGKCPLCARAVPVGHPCTYFVCQGYQKNGLPTEDADAALKLKADRSSRGEYTLSHVGRWFGEWLIAAVVSGDRNGPIFKASRRLHPRRLEVRPEPSTLRIFTADVWHEVRHLAEEQVSWRYPGIVTWDALGEVGGQGWASHRWLGDFSLLSERLLPGRPLVDIEPTIAAAILTALLDGLASLHDGGIAHGTLRPDQLAFRERGQQVDALLLGPSDLPFYVPTTQAPGGADSGLAWAAPERFEVDAASDDVSAPEPLHGDVYSAALIVAELVGGKRPFALPTLHVRRQKRDRTADPLATSRTVLPAALLEVLDAATRFEVTARLPDALVLRAKLLPLLSFGKQTASSRVPPTLGIESTTPTPEPRVIAPPEVPERALPLPVGSTPVVPAATVVPRPESAVPSPDPAIAVALARAANAEAATHAIRRAHETSEREWSSAMAELTSRLRDTESTLAAAQEARPVEAIALPRPVPVVAQRPASSWWVPVLVALAVGAGVGVFVGRSVGDGPPAGPPAALLAPLVVNAHLAPSRGGTAVRVLATAAPGEGTLVGTLRLVGEAKVQDVPVSRTITATKRGQAVVLFDDTVPFVVDKVIVVSLELE